MLDFVGRVNFPSRGPFRVVVEIKEKIRISFGS